MTLRVLLEHRQPKHLAVILSALSQLIILLIIVIEGRVRTSMSGAITLHLLGQLCTDRQVLPLYVISILFRLPLMKEAAVFSVFELRIIIPWQSPPTNLPTRVLLLLHPPLVQVYVVTQPYSVLLEAPGPGAIIFIFPPARLL